MKKHSGFTLIELLVVISIIGILSFVAVPSYQNNLVKARMMNLLMAAEPFKHAIMETVAEGRPHEDVQAHHLSIPFPKEDASALVQGISLNNGVLRVKGSTRLLGIKNSKTESLSLALKPIWTDQGLMKWQCDLESDDTKLKTHLPLACRQ